MPEFHINKYSSGRIQGYSPLENVKIILQFHGITPFLNRKKKQKEIPKQPKSFVARKKEYICNDKELSYLALQQAEVNCANFLKLLKSYILCTTSSMKRKCNT